PLLEHQPASVCRKHQAAMLQEVRSSMAGAASHDGDVNSLSYSSIASRRMFPPVGPYLGQSMSAVREAVFGNVGSLIAFRVGGLDAEALEQMFAPEMLRTHFLDLKKYEVIASIQDKGSPPAPFVGRTLAPLPSDTGRRDTVI